MPIRNVIAAVGIAAAACSKQEEPLERLPFENWRTDLGSDHWVEVMAERIDPHAAASPEALRHAMGSKAPIVSRKVLGDGFSTTFGGTTYVVRELGKHWYRCEVPITDDHERDDQAVRACESYKRPR